MMTPVLPLFVVIFLEGYIVLSTELLAIRLLTPFTGSGTDTVSVIIAAVLLPLACGYYAGGLFRPGRGGRGAVRAKLVRNLVVSACILTPGLSYVFLELGFVAFQQATGIHNRIVLTAMYSALFIVLPVFLLGQTVPLVSNYFSRQSLPRVAGKILFFSTLGSFVGAVFCTLVLMNWLGVHHTVSVTIGAMALLAFILSKKKASAPVAAGVLCLAVSLLFNGGAVMKHMKISSNNLYSTVQVVDDDERGLRKFQLNRTIASVIYKYTDETYSDYARFVEDNFIFPPGPGPGPKSILVLGAGGFMVGRTDGDNRYVFVDIDPALRGVAEDLFLEEKLGDNKAFVAMDARAYLLQSREKFDLIIVDLYRDAVNMPESLVSREFMEEVRAHLRDGGVMVGNFVASVTFSDAWSRNLDATLRAAFPFVTRQIVREFNAWQRDKDWANIVYFYVHQPAGPVNVYTDNINRSALDRPADVDVVR